MSSDDASQQQRDDLATKKKTMKRLTCRKCEGHGFISVLKGHAAVCPFNECNCERCSSVMSMRANALIRRFRHRQPGQNLAVLKTIRSKNGNMRLRIMPKGDQVEEGTTITYSDESSARVYVVSSAMSGTSSSSPSPPLPITPPLPPTSSLTTSPTPLLAFGPDLIFEYLQQMLQANFLIATVTLHQASSQSNNKSDVGIDVLHPSKPVKGLLMELVCTLIIEVMSTLLRTSQTADDLARPQKGNLSINVTAARQQLPVVDAAHSAVLSNSLVHRIT
ncbi:unnamed protein product [Nippostrongylus brasiliensis]|uniref:DM domain-containing protein n=1 Tax=Nippostrongylus brasiliensis TaxID=27835 RepID=A0A0N4XU18_NIPBR|nr:unnamed protein product [Nippostrongylus brasiliensis]